MGAKSDLALETKLRELTSLRWTALAIHLVKKTDPVRFVTKASRGSRFDVRPPDMPLNLDEIPTWYASEYEWRISGPRNDMRRMNEAILNPGRTWRSGCATEVFGPSPQYPYYPDGVAGSQIAPSANSKRQKTEQDTVKGGELYNSPVDPSAPSLTQAIEEPGVFAGFSANRNLPDIRVSWGAANGYVWCPCGNAWTSTTCIGRLPCQVCFRTSGPVGLVAALSRRPLGTT